MQYLFGIFSKIGEEILCLTETDGAPSSSSLYPDGALPFANNSNLLRPNEIKKIGTDPTQIYKDLKWRAKLNIDQIIKKLLLDELY